MTAEKVFVVVSCYDALNTIISDSIPTGITEIADAKSATQRMKEVLMAEEWIDNANVLNEEIEIVSVKIKKASAVFGISKVLENVNLDVESPGLIGVTGPTG